MVCCSGFALVWLYGMEPNWTTMHGMVCAAAIRPVFNPGWNEQASVNHQVSFQRWIYYWPGFSEPPGFTLFGPGTKTCQFSTLSKRTSPYSLEHDHEKQTVSYWVWHTVTPDTTKEGYTLAWELVHSSNLSGDTPTNLSGDTPSITNKLVWWYTEHVRYLDNYAVVCIRVVMNHDLNASSQNDGVLNNF
jgi:hypothetical protein